MLKIDLLKLCLLHNEREELKAKAVMIDELDDGHYELWETIFLYLKKRYDYITDYELYEEFIYYDNINNIIKAYEETYIYDWYKIKYRVIEANNKPFF